MSSLTTGFIPYNNPYMVAAIEKRGALSAMVENAFSTSTTAIETIIPVFSSVAEGIIHKMDKIGNMGKGGQMANAQQGIGNDAVNKERKVRRQNKPSAFLFTKK